MGVLHATDSATIQNRSEVVNDFSMVVATANGTGSQTSNMALLRAFFKMGIPVNGKNVFPSNIQGLPTWYHIRVNKDGYVARKHVSEILVAFNTVTLLEDIQNLPAGGMCVTSSDFKGIPDRDDIIMYQIPVNQFVKESGMKGKFRDYIANMVYVGAVAQLLHIPLAEIDEALNFLFNGRRKLVDSNMGVVTSAYNWTAENIEKSDPFSVKPMNETEGLIMMTGNEAAALGSVYGGVTFTAWYPITPSTSMIDALNKYLPQLRRSENGETTYAVIQAEDELAAAGMILGSGWAGGRSLTSTSGPGISLMSEFIGLGYFAELPAVIWNIQRVGPSTGLPTRTSQGDLLFCYFLGHGDTKNVILLPATIKECFDFGIASLDLADLLQTPVLVLSDLDLGMNNWMSEPFDYPTEPINRGKVLTAEEVEAKGFARYRDVDGDGICYRTLPGNEHPLAAFFTRGTGHDESAVYSERGDVWIKNMDRLVRKFNTARTLVPAPVIDVKEKARVGIISFGTTIHAVEEGRDRLADDGVVTSFLRIRALPINESVREFVENHDRVYVIEMNRDGQMYQILSLELPELTGKMHSLALLDGMPLTARWVVDSIMAQENK